MYFSIQAYVGLFNGKIKIENRQHSSLFLAKNLHYSTNMVMEQGCMVDRRCLVDRGGGCRAVDRGYVVDSAA